VCPANTKSWVFADRIKMVNLEHMSRWIALFSLFILTSCSHMPRQQNPEHPVFDDTFSCRAFGTVAEGYGFDILKNGLVYIHQPIVPCIPGHKTFASAAGARLLGQYLADKLQTGRFEFLLQRFELDSLFHPADLRETQTPDPLPTKTPDPHSTQIKTPNPSPTETQTPNPSPTETQTPNPLPAASPVDSPALPDPPFKDQWTAKENVPFGKRAGGFCFCIGKNVYVGSGECYDAIIKDFWTFDTKTCAWTCLAEIPGKCFSGITFALSNKGYVGLGTEIGTSSGKFVRHMYAYDPVANRWNILPDFPGSPRIDAISFVIDEKAYVGSGYDGTNTRDFYAYEPRAGTWQRIPDFPGGDIHAAVGAGTGSRGFVIGGARAPHDYKFVYEYTPAAHAWVKRSDFPSHPRNFHCGTAIDDNFIVMGTGGSYEINVRLKDFYLYDIAADSWSAIPDYPADASGTSRPIGAAVDGKAYFGTGFDADYTNDWNQFEHYFSVRPDTGVYDERTGYPLKYDGRWQIYQECWQSGSYAGLELKSKVDVGDFCYRSEYSPSSPRRFILHSEKTPAEPVFLRLFFTASELSQVLEKTHQTLNNVTIIRRSGSDSSSIVPRWYSYGYKGGIEVAEFSTPDVSGEFYVKTR
jgi:N-acetylneuraminic acid mutarotase